MASTEKKKHKGKKAIKAYEEITKAKKKQRKKAPPKETGEELPKPRPYGHAAEASHRDMQRPARTTGPVPPVGSVGISGDTKTWRPAADYRWGPKERERIEEPEEEPREEGATADISEEAKEAAQKAAKKKKDKQ